jgi:hypothetical protein
MLRSLPLPLSFALLVGLAAPAFSDPGWDHRAMQSHHQATDDAELELGPGERRVGRIVIGAPAESSRAGVPDTLDATTQRQWIQRGSFSGGPTTPSFNAPKIRAGRHDGTHGASHSSPSR